MKVSNSLRQHFTYNFHIFTVLFDRALEGNLSEGKDYLELWTAYCDFMRRRVDFERDGQEEVERKMTELRTVFARARSHLNKCKRVMLCLFC